ncbi:MAG: AsmA-like C-terminal region-containing protein, partial [Duncaniella sp.]|nr:AsmA-like C-terminal region-containing protein [Duncaniella sp.]
IRLTGEATLSDLNVSMPEIPIDLYSRQAELKLGTNTSFVRDNLSADSLLTLSLRLDTLSAHLDGIEARVGALKAGLGSRNVAASIDTTRINPIGGRIEVGRLLFRDLTDSTRVFLRGATIGGALTRYKGNAREPQLSLNISSATTFYGDSTMRAILRDLSSTVRIHPSDSPVQQLRRARTDSLRRLYPNLSRDSISAMVSAISRSERRARRAAAGSDSTSRSAVSDSRASLEVDRSLKTILRRWNASGSIKAARMRLFTPLFPLRNSVEGLDMRFTTDSVSLHETAVRLGRTDFRVNGVISNISRALTSRGGRESLHARFTLTSDTIDVNELASATFAGAAYADSHSGAVYLDDAGMDEQALQSQVASAAASVDTAGVLIIPANIEAALEVDASNILYSDLAFRNFTGTLNAFDGALNLANLSARSDVGSLNLNALYTAPSRQDASFAFDLGVDKLRIGQFLDLIPSIDSLMPALNGIDGVIDATVAATSRLDSVMNLIIPSLKAAVRISGDSLVVMDDETYRKISRWLLFKDKRHNMIDSMTVEMLIDDSRMQMFPFIFNIDRYRLGVEGTNDLAMNLNYHIAVLKSPLPFRFGINITGNVDKMKIRLGRARFSEKNMPRTVAIADTTRINLVKEIRDVFRRGVSRS